MTNDEFQSGFFDYLVDFSHNNPDQSQFPSVTFLHKELGTSVTRLLDQLEVTRALELIDLRLRTCIKLRPSTFTKVVWQSLTYAISIDRQLSDLLADLREYVELAYWYEAAGSLATEDKSNLNKLIFPAYYKIEGKSYDDSA
jgi:hypothetical protein